MKQKIAGSYYAGFEEVQIVLREGDGGEFYGCPGKGTCPRIKIGADYKNWSDVVRVFIHEAFEFAMFRQNARYDRSGDVSKDSGAYKFMFDHAEFSNMSSRVSELVVEALPAIATAWKKWNKK